MFHQPSNRTSGGRTRGSGLAKLAAQRPTKTKRALPTVPARVWIAVKDGSVLAAGLADRSTSVVMLAAQRGAKVESVPLLGRVVGVVLRAKPPQGTIG